MPVTIFGIRNCDTMKKARAWLEAHGVDHVFHDYRKEGIEADRLKSWAKALGWDVLLNRKGTTFRQLPDAQKEGLSEPKAIGLMVANPSMIKRPVVDKEGSLLVGFSPALYEDFFSSRGR
jgi:arsenate reductase (glutaredoxin)